MEGESAIYAEHTTDFSDTPAILGRHVDSTGDNYGIGVQGEGGIMGVRGEAFRTVNNSGYGVYGIIDGTSTGCSFGVYGAARADGINYGVYGIATGGTTNYAGYFSGLLHSLSSTAGVKAFKIDHPLDPENRYLYHSSVESPDMMNVYNGNVVLNENGEATVEMADWFDTLNRDFRYQLTAIGAPGPNLYVAEKINNNRFKISGGEPATEVSWQVTGIRQDPFANVNRVKVEVAKTGLERGRYLHPEAYGQPEERGVDYLNRVQERDSEDERPNNRAASNSPEVVEDPLDRDTRAKAAVRRHELRSETEAARVSDAGAGVRRPADASETFARYKRIATGRPKLSDTGAE